jgi:hypothetical protein
MDTGRVVSRGTTKTLSYKQNPEPPGNRHRRAGEYGY